MDPSTHVPDGPGAPEMLADDRVNDQPPAGNGAGSQRDDDQQPPAGGEGHPVPGDGGLIPACALPAASTARAPAAVTGAALAAAEEVLEGELVTDTDHDAGRRLRVVAMRLGEPGRLAGVGRVTVSAGVLVCQGLQSWGWRGWDAATMGVYRRQIRAAEAMGDRALLAEWVDRKDQAIERRHRRWLELPRLAAGIARVVVGALVALVVLTLVAGLLVQLSGAGTVSEILTGVLGMIRWTCQTLALAWTPVLVLGPVLLVLAAWREGRHRGRVPGWLATAADADVDVSIDETTIAAALAALRIPQITAYLKQGLPVQYLTPARRDGRGTHAVLRLPAGVTAERIARRRADLATGLHRLAKEVWPTTGSEAGILDLWVADKGALAQGAGPYPLLEHGVTDVFKGVPFGRTLRGEPILAPLMERNTITGGMPGQGKSSAARVLMLGAALDPTVELRIWVPDSNFDFEAFRPRCSRYVMGAETERIAKILDHLRELHGEVQTRGQLLIRYETPAVTRELATKRVGLHPLVCLLEEAHVAIQHGKHGGEISQLLIDIVRLGRKRGIHLIVSTQAPTKDSMPRDVTRNCSNGIAFAVGDHVANDALLGQGAYAGGHRATELIPGTDMGTAVVKGFTGQRSEMVQAYFVSVAKGNDQVTPIITRSLAAITQRGWGWLVCRAETPMQPPRDLLTDLTEVLGTDRRLRTHTVLTRLAAHHPDHYQGWTFTHLRAALAKHHITPVKSDGVMVIRAHDITQALTHRHPHPHDEADPTTGAGQGPIPGSGSSPYPPP